MSRVHTNTGPTRTAGPDRCGFCEQEWPCHGYRLEEADARALAGRAVQDDGLPAEAQLVDIIEQAIFETDTGLEAALLAAERIIAYRAAPPLPEPEDARDGG